MGHATACPLVWRDAEAIAADRKERISGESTEASVMIRARRLEKALAGWDSPMLSAMALSPGVAACGKLAGTCDGTGSCGVGGSGAATQLQSSFRGMHARHDVDAVRKQHAEEVAALKAKQAEEEARAATQLESAFRGMHILPVIYGRAPNDTQLSALQAEADKAKILFLSPGPLPDVELESGSTRRELKRTCEDYQRFLREPGPSEDSSPSSPPSPSPLDAFPVLGFMPSQRPIVDLLQPIIRWISQFKQ